MLARVDRPSPWLRPPDGRRAGGHPRGGRPPRRSTRGCRPGGRPRPGWPQAERRRAHRWWRGVHHRCVPGPRAEAIQVHEYHDHREQRHGDRAPEPNGAWRSSWAGRRLAGRAAGRGRNGVPLPVQAAGDGTGLVLVGGLRQRSLTITIRGGHPAPSPQRVGTEWPAGDPSGRRAEFSASTATTADPNCEIRLFIEGRRPRGTPSPTRDTKRSNGCSPSSHHEHLFVVNPGTTNRCLQSDPLCRLR